MYADGRHCLQPKKATEIYNKKSTNQCSSNAGNPAGFIFTPNKPSQTNIFFIGATLFKTKLLQQLKSARRKMLLMELYSFADGSCTSATIVMCRTFLSSARFFQLFRISTFGFKICFVSSFLP